MKKIVLAYSGGLDTSIILRWLQEKYRAEVIAYTSDIGQEIKLIKVETADEMFKATQKNLPADIAIFSAAVADFKINVKNKDKIKKKESLNIKLEKNVDILNYISNHNSMRPKLVIGFAAETENLSKNALSKLKQKNCDIIIANDVSKKDIGFNSEYNKVSVIDKKGKIKTIPKNKKSFIANKIAQILLDKLVDDRNIN